MSYWSLSSKKVLIIDDFAQMRSMLISMLKNFTPKEIVQAGNGKDALEKMAQTKFDIILCDYNLGEGKDGQQVLEEAKYQSLISYNTLFIMVTAENTNQMVMGAAEYMPDTYLSKPINKNVLLTRMKKLLEKKEILLPLSDAIEANDNTKVIACCNVLLNEKVKFKFEILKIKCEHLIKSAEYDEALKISLAVLEERQIPWAMLIVGQVYYLRNDINGAEEIFRKIIDLDMNFMPAYDWLARTLQKSEKNKDAQQVLIDAVKISPKSVIRQRNLAEAAEKNNDLIQLEKSRKKVVEVGKSSCLRKSTDYTSLASVYMKNNAPEKAIDILKQTRRTFRNDKPVILESLIQLSTAYKTLNERENQISSVNTALNLAEEKELSLHGESALELAKNCMELGKTKEGEKILSNVVKEYFEDENIMQTVNNIFSDAGLEDDGKALIAKARAEVVALNNKGVKLISAGKVDDAIKLFKMAVNDLPGNITVNLNMATALLLGMQKNGPTKQEQESIKKYLNMVLCKDKNHAKALDIQNQLQAL